MAQEGGEGALHHRQGGSDETLKIGTEADRGRLTDRGSGDGEGEDRKKKRKKDILTST
jgi:hypothetical protein